MNFLEKIDFMMNKLNINKSKLSEISGVPYTTIDSFYKKGYENTKLSTIRKMAEALNVSLDYLVDDNITDEYYGQTNGFKINYNEMQHIKKYRTLDKYGKETVSGVLEFEYKRCREQEKDEISASIEPNIIYLPDPIQSASAGHGQLADDDTANMIAIQANTITSKANYIMRVSGDSMEPKFFDGQRVLVRNQPSVDLGEIGIFLIDGERYIKIYRGNHLESANPNYPDVQFDEYSKCLGRVLDILKDDWIIND